MDYRKIFWLLALLLVAVPASAQLVSTGGETTVFFSPPAAQVLTNSPVNPNLLVNAGNNEFIFDTHSIPNAIANVYVTNDTANPCNNLTVTFAASGAPVNSFNTSPGFWQTVPIIPSAAGASFVSSTGAITLSANATVKITTVPLSGTRMVMFLPLSSACNTTTIDVNVFFSSPTVSNSLSSPKTGLAAASPLTLVSDTYSQSYAVSQFITNATAGEEISGLHNQAATTKTIYLDRVVISTTSTTVVPITLQLSSTLGTTCTSGTVSASNGLKVNTSIPPIAASLTGPCGTNPGSLALIARNMGVSNSAPVTIDLKGVILPLNTTTGVDVVSIGAVTGALEADYYWYEF
jgi:hypothetical protein